MLDSFISIRCRLALYSFGVLFIFCTVFLVNQKVYAEDVPWTSVSNEGNVYFFKNNLCIVMIEGEKILFHLHLKGVNMVGKIGDTY